MELCRSRENCKRRWLFQRSPNALVNATWSAGGRNHGAQNAFRDLAAVPLLEKIGSHGARPAAQAAYRQHVARGGAIDHDRRHTGDVHQVALQNTQRDACRNAGIHGIAAGLKHGERGMGGAVMSGDGHVASSEQQRAHALDAGNGEGLRDGIAGHLSKLVP